MNKDKINVVSHIVFLILAGIALVFVGIKYALPILLPFLLAWIIAFAIRRPADFIAKKLKISRKITRTVLSLAVILSLVGGIVFLVFRMAAEAWQLVTHLSEDGTLSEIIGKIFDPFENVSMAPELQEKLSAAISGMFSEVISFLGTVLTDVAGSVPKILLFILVTSISTVYTSLDFEGINAALRSLLPMKLDRAISEFKQTTFSVLLKYMRSYLLIMLLTFAIVLFGLSVLGVRYALLLAAVIAVLDLLPVIGVGTVMIPWSVFGFISGDVKLGVGLLVLFAVVEIARQIVEPKIFGTSLGIHPLLTLILMYVGYSVFGLFGLIILPAFSIIISVLFAKSKTADVE